MDPQPTTAPTPGAAPAGTAPAGDATYPGSGRADYDYRNHGRGGPDGYYGRGPGGGHGRGWGGAPWMMRKRSVRGRIAFFASVAFLATLILATRDRGGRGGRRRRHDRHQ